MNKSYAKVYTRGKWILVPSVCIGDRTVIIHGRFIRTASVHLEDWIEQEPVEDPERFISKVKEHSGRIDIFSFSRRLPEITKRFQYHTEWDNVAAIHILSFEDWWQKRLSRKTRQEVNRSQRLGVTARIVPFSEDLTRDIVKLFNAIRIKQGLPFSHHGKDYDSIKRDISSFIDRSAFVGAYYQSELIGYIKIVFMGRIASILNIITNDTHYDKRPGNALIAEAVKLCAQRGFHYLQYGKYVYGNKTVSSLIEFKRRNGFEMIRIPRYYVPLNLKGRIIMRMKLHQGILRKLPRGLISPMLKLRSEYYRRIVIPLKSLKSANKA